MWHRLQELGGIHKSRAERQLVAEIKAQVNIAEQQLLADPLPVAAVEATTPEPIAEESHSDDPDAGTFRQPVEAAEGCRILIIHSISLETLRTRIGRPD
jgi:hypothetical protein